MSPSKPLLALPLLVLSLQPPSGGVEWETNLSAALEGAAERGGVVYVAVGMRGEGRTARLRKEVWDERDAVTAAGGASFLIACADIHRDGKQCPVYSGVSCRDHMRLEVELREELLAASASGVVATPQHVWLDPEGEVLLSVPYELDLDELRWCFWLARARVDEERAGPSPEDARPPRRLLVGELYAPGPVDPLGRGLTTVEVEENVKELKGSMLGGGRIGRMLRLLFTDEEEAVDYARMELGSALLSWGGTQMLERAVHTMGVLSPAEYWEVIAGFTREAKPSVRNETAVALEQLGERRALKVVKAALSKEKDPLVRKNWLRALGACGWKDKSTRKSLLKTVQKEADDLQRRNALFALGYLLPHPDVDARLREELRGAALPEDRLAAACAMALSRRPSFRPDLAQAIEGCADEKLRDDLERAASVLAGENLREIEEPATRVLGDTLKRERIFFHARGGPVVSGR